MDWGYLPNKKSPKELSFGLGKTEEIQFLH